MSKNTFIDDAKKELQSKHEELQFEVAKNLNKAKQNPEFYALNKRKRELVFELGKYFNNDDTAKQIIEELKDITKKQEKVLKTLNLTFDDLKERYFCEKCKDKGVLDGKHCTCLKQSLSKLLLQECGINKTELPKFSDVDYSLYSDSYVKNMKLIFNNLEAYVNDLKNQKKQVVTVTGPTGVGKTFLTECVVGRAVELGYYTIYTPSNALNMRMANYHIAPLIDKQKIIEPYLTCDLLIIDDLGTEPIYNNVTIEYLYLVISERLRAGLYTFINTNLSPNQMIDVYGERIFSRIANINNGLLIDMTANDVRIGLRK